MMRLLPEILHKKVLPWAGSGTRQRIIVARPPMSAAALPDGVQLARRKLRGKRVVVKGRRLYGNVSSTSARWPDDGLHEIEHPKLICVVGGQTDFQIGEYVVSCGEGHFLFIPPGTPHSDGSRPHLEGLRLQNGSCDLLQILQYRRGFNCWLCHSHGSQHHSDFAEHCLVLNDQAVQLFNLLMEEAVGRKDDYERVCETLLLGFLMMLQREIRAGHYLQMGAMTAPETMPAARSLDPVKQAQDYIQAHLIEALTLEKVARQAHMSRAQFSKLMRRETGKSFVEFVTDCRIEEAQVLLRESEWSVAAIAGFVGFKSSTYFHGLFRRRVGLSPGDFRRQSRQPKSRRRKK